MTQHLMDEEYCC